MNGAALEAILNRALTAWPDRIAKVIFRAQEALLIGGVALGDNVIDLGCGDGTFASLLGRVTACGIDRSPAACRAARASRVYRSVVAADLTRLPFPDRTFDGAFCNSTLEHVRHPEAVLAEAARVMRPGGRLAVTVPTPRKRDWLLFARMAERLPGGDPWAERYRAAFDRYWGHERYFRPEQLAGLLEASGFTVLRIEEYESRALSATLDVLNTLEAHHRHRRRYIGSPELRDVLRQLLTPLHLEPGAGVCCIAERKP